MKTVWIVSENEPGHTFGCAHVGDKVFSTKQKAESYIGKRVREIMRNREDSMTVYTRDHDNGYVGVCWTDDDGNIKRGDWGEPLEHTFFWYFEYQVDEES